MLTSAQGCFKVPAASAEAVVLTLSGLTANVALQVMLCPHTLSGLSSGKSAACAKCPLSIAARLSWSTGSASLFKEYQDDLPFMLTVGRIDRQQQDLCKKVRQCW